MYSIRITMIIISIYYLSIIYMCTCIVYIYHSGYNAYIYYIYIHMWAGMATQCISTNAGRCEHVVHVCLYTINICVYIYMYIYYTHTVFDIHIHMHETMYTISYDQARTRSCFMFDG